MGDDPLDCSRDRLDRLGGERVPHVVHELEAARVARRGMEELRVLDRDEGVGPPVHEREWHADLRHELDRRRGRGPGSAMRTPR